MPDLNLIDEGGFEESPAPAAPPMKRKQQYKGGGGGRGGLKFVIILLILAILGGGGYYLYQRGILKLPFLKKKKPPVQMQEETFIQENQIPVDSAALQAQQPADTSVALLETPAIEEKGKTQKGKTGTKAAAKVQPKAVEKAEAETEEGSDETEMSDEGGSEVKLSDMKGDYTIQVIAYSQKSKAVEMAENLEIAGYPAFVEKVPMKGGEWYTVRIGRYVTPAEAEKAVKNFADELKEHYVIDKIRGKK
jgi:cell division septation protein DedD